MIKRVEFHQVQIVATFRIVDDERSHGLRQVGIDLLVDTDQEWTAAREQIEQARQELEQNANSDQTPT